MTESMNSLLELEEERKFWENKLLEHKLFSFKNSYIIHSKNIELKNEKDHLLQENKELENQISELKNNISQIKEMKENSEIILSKLNSEISSIKTINEKNQNEINTLKEYWKNINKTNNIINHILKFPEEFKKKVYTICSEKINSVLNSNNPMTNNMKQQNYYYNPMMMNSYIMTPQMMFINTFQKNESVKK